MAAGPVELLDVLREGPLAGQAHRRGDRGVPGQEVDEVDGAAVEAEGLAGRLAVPAVDHRDGQPGDEEGRLADAGDELAVGELRAVEEDLRVGPVAHAGAGALLGRLPHRVQHGGVGEGREGVVGRGGLPPVGEAPGLAPVELHLVGHPVAVHLDVQAGREGVDHGGAHAVQASRGRVGASPELPAGVQLRVDDFHARQPVDGHASPVVAHLHRSVGVELNLYGVGVAL